MQAKRSHFRNHRQGGYVILAILFALTVLIVGLAVAAPRTVTALRRTKENELIRRGQQYALGIRRFYKKFGRYPSDLDQLENTNNIRFLRRKYVDPITGKDDWQPIQFGQARPPTGFFGEKITTTGGMSPSGPGLAPSTIGTGMAATGDSSSSTSPSTSATGQTPSGQSTSPGTSTSATGGSSSGPTGTAGNPLSTDQLTGKTFGGGAIVGVSIPSKKESLKEFQQKDHYNEWQFVYDPTMDPTLRGGVGTGAATGVSGGIAAPGINQPGTNQPFGQPLSNPMSPTTTPGSNPNPGTGSANPGSPR